MLTIEAVAPALRGALEGDVALPGDPGWNDARRAWNLAVDQRPALAVLPESADDVAAAVAFAAEHGLRVAVQGTGHGAGARGGDLADAVLVNMARLDGVQIDPERRIARAGGGALWGPVVEAAAEHGLAGLAGSSRDVGVVGYTLGGGLGWLARRHGLAANAVEAFEVVTATGARVRVDAGSEPELHWALRGGGGSFAAVTALEFRLLPLRELYAGALFWPVEQSSRVLEGYLDWVGTVSDEVTSLARILHVPQLPFVPEPLRGKSFAVVEAALLLSQEEGSAVVQPLRALAPAELDTFATVPLPALGDLHNDPPGPVPGLGDGTVLAPLDEQVVDAVVGLAGAREGTSLLSVEIRHLGGALAEAAAGHGALASIEGAFAAYAVGIAATPEQARGVEEDLERLHTALRTWSVGAFPNFAERPGAARAAFPGPVYERLRRVKAAYDPENVFRAGQEVEPAV